MAEMKTPQGLVVGLIIDNSIASEEEQQGANEQTERVVEKPKRGRKPSEV